MDSDKQRWLDTFGYDRNWETDSGRNNPEASWNGISFDVPPDFDDNQDTWNDQRRRERLAEACYEC